MDSGSMGFSKRWCGSALGGRRLFWELGIDSVSGPVEGDSSEGLPVPSYLLSWTLTTSAAGSDFPGHTATFRNSPPPSFLEKLYFGRAFSLMNGRLTCGYFSVSARSSLERRASRKYVGKRSTWFLTNEGKCESST